MPTPGQIDPQQIIERNIWETDEQYAERMARIAKREAMFASIVTPTHPQEGDDGRG